MEEVRYYNSPITLEEAEQYIQSGLITAARAYVANGYYLRRIRDDKLFEEARYQNFENYVRGKYNKDKGWASKCIKVNQQLSEGGDSPILSKQYLEYSTYQLVELAYMTEEQREEAAPDMTVNQLKQIRKPEEAEELEKSCDVTTSEPEGDQEPGEVPKRKIHHFVDGDLSIDNAYGASGAEIVNRYLETGYKSPDKECEVAAFGCNYKVLKRENVSVFYSDSGETLFDVENTRLAREFNFFFGKKAEPESKESEEEREDLPQLGFYNPDDDSLVDESYSLANIPRASDRHVTMLARLFVQEKKARLIYGGGFIGISDEEIINMLKLHYRETIVIDNDVNVSVGAGVIDFFRGDEDLGICLFKKFANYVRKQIDEYIDQMAEKQENHNQDEPESKEPETVIEAPENIPKQAESLPEPSETVIDGVFVEVLPESETPDYTPQFFLQEQSEKLDKYLRMFKEKEPGPSDIKFLECQKTIVAALACMVAELEKPEPEPEPETVKQEQPELPILKNNDQRATFIDAYETWPLWIETKETGERCYRYNLPDGTSIVVKVYHARIFDYHVPGSYEDKYKEGWGEPEYYLLKDGKFFRNCRTSRPDLIEKLKELQKKGKDKNHVEN